MLPGLLSFRFRGAILGCRRRASKIRVTSFAGGLGWRGKRPTGSSSDCIGISVDGLNMMGDTPVALEGTRTARPWARKSSAKRELGKWNVEPAHNHRQLTMQCSHRVSGQSTHRRNRENGAAYACETLEEIETKLPTLPWDYPYVLEESTPQAVRKVADMIEEIEEDSENNLPTLPWDHPLLFEPESDFTQAGVEDSDSEEEIFYDARDDLEDSGDWHQGHDNSNLCFECYADDQAYEPIWHAPVNILDEYARTPKRRTQWGQAPNITEYSVVSLHSSQRRVSKMNEADPQGINDEALDEAIEFMHMRPEEDEARGPAPGGGTSTMAKMLCGGPEGGRGTRRGRIVAQSIRVPGLSYDLVPAL
ncbi:hypothetical protein B0H16DRAFT_1469542 [Mycena metata]|uniref:Uncharacterized protein n=1 Tax=Mycena metata TaxID=1033252 RepID=A0AAD7MTZ4_9AGAR|nr:hypothetical protein B0H16DRAFT_1469542 [Mycena metata]